MASKKTQTHPFDMVDILDSDEAIAEYFSQVLEDGDNAEIVRALGYIARARGMAQLAADTGLGRESLYKALAPNALPRFDTILKVTRALGLPLQCKPQMVKTKPVGRKTTVIA